MKDITRKSGTFCKFCVPAKRNKESALALAFNGWISGMA